MSYGHIDTTASYRRCKWVSIEEHKNEATPSVFRVSVFRVSVFGVIDMTTMTQRSLTDGVNRSL